MDSIKFGLRFYGLEDQKGQKAKPEISVQVGGLIGDPPHNKLGPQRTTRSG